MSTLAAKLKKMYWEQESLPLEYRLAHSNRAGDSPYIRYELNADDAPVGGKWQDRHAYGNNPKLSWAPSNAVYDSTLKMWDCTASGAYLNANIGSMDLGNHFAVYISGLFYRPVKDTWYSMVVDLGSVVGTDRNIGFIYGKYLNDNIYKYSDCNWKLKGNNSNPGLIHITDQRYPDWTVEPFRLEYFLSISQKNETYDKATYVINGTKVVVPVDVPKVSYNSWQIKAGYIGRGHVGGVSSGKGYYERICFFVYD